MVPTESGTRPDFFLAVFRDDGSPRNSRHSRNFLNADFGASRSHWKIYNRPFYTDRDRRPLLALRGHRLDFSFPSFVPGRTPLMGTATHPPKIYWRTCAALMLLLALIWTIGYIDLGMFVKEKMGQVWRRCERRRARCTPGSMMRRSHAQFVLTVAWGAGSWFFIRTASWFPSKAIRNRQSVRGTSAQRGPRHINCSRTHGVKRR